MQTTDTCGNAEMLFDEDGVRNDPRLGGEFKVDLLIALGNSTGLQIANLSRDLPYLPHWNHPKTARWAAVTPYVRLLYSVCPTLEPNFASARVLRMRGIHAQ